MDIVVKVRVRGTLDRGCVRPWNCLGVLRRPRGEEDVRVVPGTARDGVKLLAAGQEVPPRQVTGPSRLDRRIAFLWQHDSPWSVSLNRFFVDPMLFPVANERIDRNDNFRVSDPRALFDCSWGSGVRNCDDGVPAENRPEIDCDGLRRHRHEDGDAIGAGNAQV